MTLDHPQHCDCFAKALDPATCDCACHVPTRDNTVTDDDLALDRIKARVAELEAEIEKANDATCDREFDESAPDQVKRTSRRQGNETAVDALVREHQEFIKRGWSRAIHEEWGAGDFCGPCAHGRDPYTRCDECEDLTPRQALERALLAPVTVERDRLRENVRELRNHIDVLNTAHDAVSARVKQLTVERDAARAELAATKAGADHLQTSLTRANARIEALATESAGLLRERNDLRELLRMAGVTP